MDRMNTRLLRLLVVALAGVLLGFLAEYLGVFGGIDRFAFDVAFRLRGASPPSDRILIVAVDEKSLRELGQWPLGRSRYVALLNAAQEADAVGFTIIMAEPTDQDQLLASAIQRHGRVVLPVYVDDSLRFSPPARRLDGAAVGHLHVEEDLDGVVRSVFNSLVLNGRPIPSLAKALLATASGFPSFAMQSRREQGGVDGGIIQSDPVIINYHGPAGTFRTLPLADIVKGCIPQGTFRGKIVLVGLTAAGTAERFGTPFSERRTRMPSVEVHANVLNSLIQGGGIRTMDMRLRLGICLILAPFWYLAFMRLRETRAGIVWLLSLAVTALAIFCAFSLHSRWIDPAILMFTPSYLYLATAVLRLDEAARRLQNQYGLMTACLGDSAGLPEDGAVHTGLLGYLSTGGINGNVAIIEKVIRRMMEHASRLQAANREMEAFSYSVSHDLQAPLRRIRGFSLALTEDCAKYLDETGLDYLKRISGGVGRMERLIDGLLTLSRISRSELHREQVDLSGMAQEIAGELHASKPERQVEFMIEEGVMAQGDAAMLRAVMTNLLENAWKFTAAVQQPIIVFEVQDHDGEQRYLVRDNGAGFDMTYVERIFAPFQRLHDEADFPGTGIGLSTVQRIIHLHGGDIAAEGEPGKGATFTFTLSS